MGGRVKTLHPKLYAGLLALRDDEEHMAAAAEHEVEFVDLVCVNLYPFEATAARRGVDRARGDREHRHRRPDDDPRGGQELRLHRGRGQPGQLRRGAAGAHGRRRQALARHARVAGGRGVLLHRPLRQRDLALVRREAGRLPAAAAERLREGHRPRLRREPAPARRLLRAGRRAHARALDGAPARRQGAVVQQRAGPQLRAPADAGVRAARVHDHQAQQPVRRRGRRLGAGGLRRGLRVRSDVGLRRRDLRQPRASTPPSPRRC